MRDYIAVLGGMALALGAGACGSSSERASASRADDLTKGPPPAPTLTFAADWTQSASGPLVAGGQAAVVYDEARLATCREEQGGSPMWGATGYASVNGLPAQSFPVAGLVPPGSPAPPLVDLPVAGDLQMWFEATNVSGCHAWDSAYGANYHFAVAAPPDAPGWAGDARVVIDRDSCGGNPCAPGVVHPLDGGFTFGTLERQQMGYTQVFFQAWKQGVTDWDDPDLWRQLDVELHARIGDQGPFTMTYVDFRAREGNNAEYAFDLRAVDPLATSGGALTDPAQCPTFPTTLSADGQLIEADWQFYVTVSGVGVQPAGGGVFHGTFQNYAGLFAICSR
jgi:hypothetical protein